MEKITRFGVSIEPDLLNEFDALIKKKGYTNRSEAIRDLVRKSITESRIEVEKGKVIGALAIVYDHDVGNVTNELLGLQHRHLSEIISTTHVHLTKHTCFEVIVVHGEAKDIRKLADSIKALKGVKHGDLFLTKTL
jgi:CopG family nickel-responsive transcriptional regulator